MNGHATCVELESPCGPACTAVPPPPAPVDGQTWDAAIAASTHTFDCLDYTASRAYQNYVVHDYPSAHALRTADQLLAADWPCRCQYVVREEPDGTVLVVDRITDQPASTYTGPDARAFAELNAAELNGTDK